jgi:hypothetical protein
MAKKLKTRTKRKPGAKRRKATTKQRRRTKGRASMTMAQPLRASQPGAELEIERSRSNSATTSPP